MCIEILDLGDFCIYVMKYPNCFYWGTIKNEWHPATSPVFESVCVRGVNTVCMLINLVKRVTGMQLSQPLSVTCQSAVTISMSLRYALQTEELKEVQSVALCAFQLSSHCSLFTGFFVCMCSMRHCRQCLYSYSTETYSLQFKTDPLY